MRLFCCGYLCSDWRDRVDRLVEAGEELEADRLWEEVKREADGSDWLHRMRSIQSPSVSPLPTVL